MAESAVRVRTEKGVRKYPAGSQFILRASSVHPDSGTYQVGSDGPWTEDGLKVTETREALRKKILRAERGARTRDAFVTCFLGALAAVLVWEVFLSRYFS